MGFTALMAFFVTFFGIPSIVRVSELKKLYDMPGRRKVHDRPIPTLGGVAIFSGVILASVLFSSMSASHELKYIIAGMITIFFVGLKDDIVPLTPYKKLIGQVAATFFIVVPGDIRLTSLHDVLGIGEIGYIPGVIITFIFFLMMINSFNLIDGIDGLAAGIGIVASMAFGIWYIVDGHYSYAVFSVALTGSLIAFFWYNVFSIRYKIFLGDTGSLLIGLLLAVFAIRLLEFESGTGEGAAIDLSPALILAFLIVPLYDFVRVFLNRLAKGKSPFSPDRTHIHHRLLYLTGSHLRVTLIIVFINLMIIFLTLLFRNLSVEILMASIILTAGLLSYIPVILKNRAEQRLANS